MSQYSIEELHVKKEFDKLVRFSTELVIKDSELAEANETIEISKSSYEYISAIFKTDTLANYSEGIEKYKYLNEVDGEKLLEKLRNERIDSYSEYNTYYTDLITKYGLNSVQLRTANDFYILHYPSYILSDIETKKFLEYYYQNLRYFNAVLYNKAFASYELYRNFVRMFLVFMTIERCISSKMEDAYNIDLYDEWALNNMFVSYGLDYFRDLPVKYQRRILKNVNNLIKNKGSNKAIIDIVKLFGFENVRIFKHFLAKEYPRDSSGRIKSFTDVNLKFYKTEYTSRNIQKDIFKFPSDNYTSFTEGDPYWQASKEEVLEKNFNFVATKYFSVDATLDIFKNNLNISYLVNLLKYIRQNNETSNYMTFYNTAVSNNPMNLVDVIIAMQALVLRCQDVKDNIIKNGSSLNQIYKYDFDDELMNSYIIDSKDMMVNPEDIGDITGNKMLNMFIKNREFRTNLQDKILNAKDHSTYKKLTNLWNIQFISEYNNDLFYGYNTYSDYLKDTNSDLYDYVINASNPSKALLELATSVEVYIDHPDFDMFLKNSNVVEYVGGYMKILINLFKAYTTDLKDFTITYLIDDNFFNSIHWHDDNNLEKTNLASGLIQIEDDITNILEEIAKVEQLKDLLKDSTQVYQFFPFKSKFELLKAEIKSTLEYDIKTDRVRVTDDIKADSIFLRYSNLLLESKEELTSILYSNKDIATVKLDEMQNISNYFLSVILFEFRSKYSIDGNMSRLENLLINDKNKFHWLFDFHDKFIFKDNMTVGSPSHEYYRHLLKIDEKDFINSNLSKVDYNNINDKAIIKFMYEYLNSISLTHKLESYQDDIHTSLFNLGSKVNKHYLKKNINGYLYHTDMNNINSNYNLVEEIKLSDKNFNSLVSNNQIMLLKIKDNFKITIIE